MLSDPKTYLKAILAALIAGLGAATTALTDNAMVVGEWVAIAAATLAAFGGVYGISNRPAEAPVALEPEGGALPAA